MTISYEIGKLSYIMKKQSTFSVWAILLVFAVSGCFSPWKENTAQFTLVLGDNSGASRAAGQGHSHPDPAVLDELEHSVVLSNGAETVTLFAAKGQKSIEAVVAAGKWDIAVTTFRGDDLYATGSTTANLQPGQNNVVAIAMNPSLAVSLQRLPALIENNDGGNYTIAVYADESIVPQALEYTAPATITLVGVGAERVISLKENGSLFTISPGVTLVLGNNITLKGHSSNDASLVTVLIYYGSPIKGVLEMLPGSKITGNTNNSGYGGGVNVTGTFNMHGGEITNNTAYNGGGMWVAKNGAFNMHAGTISQNNASEGGGVGLDGEGGPGTGIKSAAFTMYGGNILDNHANLGNARGGGVWLQDAIFHIVNGSISGNTSTNNGKELYISRASGTNFIESEVQHGIFNSNNTWSKNGDYIVNYDDDLDKGKEGAYDRNVYYNNPLIVVDGDWIH